MRVARTTAERLRLLARVLAMADERQAVRLTDAAAEVGIDVEGLRELLEPVLYLEWRDPLGDLHGETRAFLVTEDDHLVVTDEHWLRGLASKPPDPPSALRLFTAGVVLQAATSRQPSPALDRALAKLSDVLQADVVVHVEPPPWTQLCERQHRRRRTLRIRYLSAVHGEVREHELEPHLVASKWGNWYVLGRIVGGDGAIRPFRIDRIVEAEAGERTFEPEEVELPDWWDMSEHEKTFVARLPARDLDRLPQPNRSIVSRELDGGRVEAEITVIGERHLDHVLLALSPDSEVVWPQEWRDRRRALARALLERYEATENAAFSSRP